MKKKIGVFDSGIGGLNVLNDLIEKYPSEDFLYLADTKNCPYGLKTSEEVKNITEKNIRFLEKQNVKAIVIACNTATANSYDITSSVPIIRIIEPTSKNAKAVGGVIGVLATNLTISKKAYQRFLPEAIGIPASVLVDIAESGLAGTEKSYQVLEDLLNPYQGKLDTLILGCTHFTLYTKQIKSILKNVHIVDSSLSISKVLGNYMQIENDGIGEVKILTTGNPQELNINWFNRKDVEVYNVVI